MPGKVIEVKKNKVKVSLDGHYHWWQTALLDEKIKKGDFLLSYQNAAINKISKAQAQEILSLIKKG